ncbi:MAG: hypothetical protein WCA57_16715 [Ilumatobacteraceae bacterium]
MAWKATGQPTVRKQRDKWVVRVDGIDTGTGQHRPRQLCTFNSQRSALAAARSTRAEDRSTERGTVSWLVRRYVAGRTDITLKSREQYEWAIPHIENGLGAIQLSLLDRDDVANRSRGRPLPRGLVEPPLGGRVPARRALRAAPQRDPRTSVG